MAYMVPSGSTHVSHLLELVECTSCGLLKPMIPRCGASVTRLHPAKTAELIDVLFGVKRPKEYCRPIEWASTAAVKRAHGWVGSVPKT